jgi:hypothetical protein
VRFAKTVGSVFEDGKEKINIKRISEFNLLTGICD